MGEPASYGFVAIPHRTLSLGDELGKGRFKRVHKAVLQRRPVVVLKYPLQQNVESGSMNLSVSAQNELDIFRTLSEHGRNQHVPDIYGSCQKKDALWLAQELSSYGALRSVLLNRESSLQVTVAHKIRASAQLADAMIFLKKSRVIHADLSCRNVLVFRLEAESAMTVIKLVDFGLALTLPESSDRVSHKQPRAVRWCAPETVKDSWLSHGSDAWSLGATMWELFSDGSAPWSNLVKRTDVTERLCALADKSTSFDAAAEFSQPIGCPTEMYQAMLSVLRLAELDRSSVEELQEFFAKFERGEKVCMSGEVTQHESEALPSECVEKMDVCILPCQGTEDALACVQAVEDTIDDVTVETVDFADEIVESTSSQDIDEMPVLAKRKSLLNHKTGEEEYDHHDDESDEFEGEAGDHEVRNESNEVDEAYMEDDAIDECTAGDRQPQPSLLSTAATSQGDSGASTPRTPPLMHCSKTRFDRQGPVHVGESNIRSTTPPQFARSLVLPHTAAGGRFVQVSTPGTRALTPGTTFRNPPSISIAPERSVYVQSHIPSVHISPQSFMPPRSSTPGVPPRSSTPGVPLRSSTPGVVFRPVRSQSVVQERTTSFGPFGFAGQVPGNCQEHVIKNNAAAPPVMPHALTCRTAFSVMTSAGSSSPMRLSCPSRLA